jgi:TonB-linked SusC/RagA family outer membrane protein
MQKSLHCSPFIPQEEYEQVVELIPKPLNKISFVMKRFFFLVFFLVYLGFSNVQAQTITLKAKNESLKTVLNAVEKQTGYVVFSKKGSLHKSVPVSVDVVNMPLPDFLEQTFKGQPVSFILKNKTIFLIPREPATKLPVSDTGPQAGEDTGRAGLLKGRITDNDTRQPIAGASIRLLETNAGTSSGEDGQFTLPASSASLTLLVSNVGYQSQKIKVTGMAFQDIRLYREITTLRNVYVTTGMFNRRKESFTGATSTFSGEELRRTGTINVLQSLKSLDPSFIIQDNNLMGANPNQLPKIELRGKTSINPLSGQTIQDQFARDPNQPLFILDGMETTLRRIVDLDINRVASVTILKDAASTALYGSKAANGVVVIETVRPKAGEFRITYTANGNLQTPDLSSYDMMNAAEFLEFQRLSGMYRESAYAAGFNNTDLYNQRLKEVQKGVNSYWLNTPLRNVLNIRHSLNLSGGDQKVTYAVGLNYLDSKGIMKGSGRTTWGGNIYLGYRSGKINVTNQLYIDGSESTNSPYGSFSRYVGLSPYYRKADSSGHLNTSRYLEEYPLVRSDNNPYFAEMVQVPNPLYDATLNSFDKSNSVTITNDLNMIWDVFKDIRLSGGLQIRKTFSNNSAYVPALNTSFDNMSVYEKGSLTDGKSNTFGYQVFTQMTYNKTLQDMHSITFNVRGSVQDNKVENLSSTFVGFPVGVDGFPSFAFGYQPNAKPGYVSLVSRSMGLLGSLNYSYDRRYNVDFTYTLDGSNSFGANHLFTPFWSAGLGWNIDREKFFGSVSWIEQLRLRGNIGINGNQGFGRFLSNTTYKFLSGSGIFGQGMNIGEIGNPDLLWQKTTQTSLGLDLGLARRRVFMTLNAYRKYTDPLVVPVSLPTSTGLTSISSNVGALTTSGIELNLLVTPLQHPAIDLLWTVGITGAIVKSEYSGLSGLLQNFNKSAQESNSLIRYYDGYSPDDIWAVRSLGIDPMTGAEIFLTKNNEYTDVYNADNIVKVGNSQPKVLGVVSTDLSFKGFRLNTYLRYMLGASSLNTALYNKVENISFDALKNNQDRRALYKRWKNPGDISSFRAISTTAYTPMSSRFVQKENLLAGESINVSYSFQKDRSQWLRYIRMRELRCSVTMNDIFRFTNVQIERGIDYPFAENISFTINAYF